MLQPSSSKTGPVEVLHPGEHARRGVPPPVGQHVEALVGDVEAAAGHHQRRRSTQAAVASSAAAATHGQDSPAPGTPAAVLRGSRRHGARLAADDPLRRGTHRRAPIRNRRPRNSDPNAHFVPYPRTDRRRAFACTGTCASPSWCRPTTRSSSWARSSRPRRSSSTTSSSSTTPAATAPPRRPRRSTTPALEVHRLPENQGVGGAIVHRPQARARARLRRLGGDGGRRPDGPGVPAGAARPDRRRRGRSSPRPTGSTARAPSRGCRGTGSSATSACRS